MTSLTKGPVRPEVRQNAETVRTSLFQESGAGVYAVVDGASVEGLLDQLAVHQAEFECLYRGELTPDVAEVAPYLVRLEESSAFTDWLLENGWGNHWCIFALCEQDLAAVRRHCRRLLTVHGPEGRPMLFRFYDPRVLRSYLPLCDETETKTMFGPVAAYIQEGDTPDQLIRFELDGGALVTRKKDLGKET